MPELKPSPFVVAEILTRVLRYRFPNLVNLNVVYGAKSKTFTAKFDDPKNKLQREQASRLSEDISKLRGV